MGFGGNTFNGTLNVDVVQTDVQAIVDGITGGCSLNDINNHMQDIRSCLFDSSSYNTVYTLLDHLCQSVDALNSYLYQSYPGRPAIDLLANMESYLGQIAYNTSM
jgi:hypothetical protein